MPEHAVRKVAGTCVTHHTEARAQDCKILVRTPDFTCTSTSLSEDQDVFADCRGHASAGRGADTGAADFSWCSDPG